jgi:hypothetical protein
MIMSKAKICTGSFLCLIIPSLLVGQERHQQDLDKSCREFVGTFYAWYLPKALRDNPERAWDLALKYKRYVFSSELYRQLSEDSEAQRKADGDLVGLDFDPFLRTQDPGGRYVVKRITIKDGRCWADVHAVRSGKESTTPSVTPELELKDDRWIFVNFHYQDPARPGWSWDLLRELNDLRRYREQGAAAKGKKG